MGGTLAVNDQDRISLQDPKRCARFLLALVHEMRTPLTSSSMLIELLAELPQIRAGQKERRYVDGVREVMQELLSLVDDTAEFARLLGGRVELQSKDVSLAELVAAVEDEVRPQVWEGGVMLIHSLDPALPQRIHVDPERLRQLLVLVLGATLSQAKSEVFFRLDLEEENLRAIFSSDGDPFPPRAAVFEPFSRKGTSSGSYRARGLALPLAGELAQVLGGELRAENWGERPTFTLLLPAAAA